MLPHSRPHSVHGQVNPDAQRCAPASQNATPASQKVSHLIFAETADRSVRETPSVKGATPTYSDAAAAHGGRGYWKNVHTYFSLCLSAARRPIGLYWKAASPYEIKCRDEAIAQAIGWASR